MSKGILALARFHKTCVYSQIPSGHNEGYHHFYLLPFERDRVMLRSSINNADTILLSLVTGLMESIGASPPPSGVRQIGSQVLNSFDCLSLQFHESDKKFHIAARDRKCEIVLPIAPSDINQEDYIFDYWAGLFGVLYLYCSSRYSSQNFIIMCDWHGNVLCNHGTIDLFPESAITLWETGINPQADGTFLVYASGVDNSLLNSGEPYEVFAGFVHLDPNGNIIRKDRIMKSHFTHEDYSELEDGSCFFLNGYHLVLNLWSRDGNHKCTAIYTSSDEGVFNLSYIDLDQSIGGFYLNGSVVLNENIIIGCNEAGVAVLNVTAGEK